MSTAIQFLDISKQYRLGNVGTGTLSHDLNRWWAMNIRGKEDPYLKIGSVNDRSTKADSDYIWALRDINFEVQQGEVLGIIGKNGAGKSTLLKILSRVTSPTTGVIKTRGRIASLLEVGTGFHPEMTGRENIYMNGAIMGMTKAEIRRKMDEIVDFAGVERYIDTPVKRYSSGMTVRLGFAVAAHLEPEILVVDEVLAVGDAEFQKKAIGKMQDISKGEGRTVLFVSHNMGAVRNLCNRGLVLHSGNIIFEGFVNNAINTYLSKQNGVNLLSIKDISQCRVSGYSSDVEFVSIDLVEGNEGYSTKEDIVILLSLKGNRDVNDFQVYLTIYDNEDRAIGCAFGKEKYSVVKNQILEMNLSLADHNLALGTYSISFATGKGNFAEGISAFDVLHQACNFSITSFEKGLTGYSNWNKDWGSVMFNFRSRIT
jgi:lipopolysaccharide transport system ATP-binding protein